MARTHLTTVPHAHGGAAWTAVVVLVLAVAAVCPGLAADADVDGAAPRGMDAVSVVEVASGFTWAENIRCDVETSALFVSEYRRGELYKITYDGGFNATAHVNMSTWDLFAGLAIHDESGTLYAIARESSSHDCYIVKVDKVVPNTVTRVAKLPKLGNGLAINQRTGILWATAEGDFLPFEGAVYQVFPSNGTVRTAIDHSYADDGAYVNQAEQVLVLSEVIGSEVLQFDLETEDVLQRARAPSSVDMLDDFCLSSNGTLLYGADYGKGHVVVFPVDGHTGASAAVLASNLRNPTSARWGCLPPGSPFPVTSLFVTEGNTLFGSTPNRRVLELTGVRPPP